MQESYVYIYIYISYKKEKEAIVSRAAERRKKEIDRTGR